jgi:hypothetical protein
MSKVRRLQGEMVGRTNTCSLLTWQVQVWFAVVKQLGVYSSCHENKMEHVSHSAAAAVLLLA